MPDPYQIQSVPNAHQQAGADAAIDLYESEYVACERVLAQIQQRYYGKPVDFAPEAYAREIVERFEDIGLMVEVRLLTDQNQDMLPPDLRQMFTSIYILDRIEQEDEFDHERMGHEVRSDLRGINQQGNVQKTQVAPGWDKSGSGLVVPFSTSGGEGS